MNYRRMCVAMIVLGATLTVLCCPPVLSVEQSVTTKAEHSATSLGAPVILRTDLESMYERIEIFSFVSGDESDDALVLLV